MEDNKRMSKEKQFGKMMLIIMGLFFATYFPTFLLKKVRIYNTFSFQLFSER